MTLPFREDRSLTDVLRERGFTLSAEVIPPRNGAEQGAVLTQVRTLIEAGAQFLAVTKGAGGSLRGGSLPIAQTIKETLGVPCIAHFTCRDLTPADVENQLMDHHYFGIRNILALRGDPPDGQAQWSARAGGYNYAHELIRQIRALNQGEYLVRTGGPSVSAQEATRFCIGAAVYPEHPDPTERVEFYRLKVEAGAHYAITDMLFDADAYARFLDACDRAGLARLPILPGTRILKTQKAAARMMQKFRVQIPADVLAGLPADDAALAADPASREAGLQAFLRLTERLRALGAPGIHLFVISDTPSAVAGLNALR